MTKRVNDLHGWIPEPGGPRAKGDRVPRPHEVFIERVLHVFHDHVVFSCRLVEMQDGKESARSVIYHFPMLDKEMQSKIIEILNDNIGKPLLSIGTIEIPSD